MLFSVHLNPETQAAANEILGGIDRVTLMRPVDYLPFVNLMKASTLILSDSGGMQEEAPSLGQAGARAARLHGATRGGRGRHGAARGHRRRRHRE